MKPSRSRYINSLPGTAYGITNTEPSRRATLSPAFEVMARQAGNGGP